MNERIQVSFMTQKLMIDADDARFDADRSMRPNSVAAQARAPICDISYEEDGAHVVRKGFDDHEPEADESWRNRIFVALALFAVICRRSKTCCRWPTWFGSQTTALCAWSSRCSWCPTSSPATTCC